MDSVLETIMNPHGMIGVVCILLIFSGLFALKSMKAESPLAPYVLQILGLTFILPVVILITVTIQVDGQAIMGLLGTIVGYIFGTSQVQAKNTLNSSPSSNKSSNSGAEDDGGF
ncbi:hypothetical protein [Kistimonas asteriae]|uniref:hypothetical protein n=1 Tax=Kistimonas asteriae TaxID=517724 RepID=UPI001BA4F3FD|nr:hypothetical protein [Kistimonas asteriae]